MADQNKPAKDSSAERPLDPIDRKSLESGWITKGAVSEARRPETSVEESINMDFDTIGSATLRKGTTAIGNFLSSAITGMAYFVDTVNNGEFTQIIVVSGTIVYYLLNGEWTSVAANGATMTRFCQFLNQIFMVNPANATQVWSGVPINSFVTTGSASGAPIGAFIETFISRLWIAGNPTYPCRLYYSTVPSLAVTQTVSWSADPTTGTQYFDVAPNDGDTITALTRYRNKLLVFKTNRIYRVLAIGQTDPDPWYAVGTTSQESVVETKNGVYFFHSSGFYQYNVYDIVQEISGPLRLDVIQAIPESSWGSVTGWLHPDGDHIIWSVGTVTVRGVTYTNLHLRYSISTMVWSHRVYPTQTVASIRRQPFYTDGTKQYGLVGDNQGNILEMDTGLTDTSPTGLLGTPVPISFSVIHRWETCDDLLSTRKTAMTANFSHYGGADATVAYQTEDNDPSNLGDWSKKVGVLKTKNTGFNSMNIKARKFRFRIFGQSYGVPFAYNGYELLGVLAEFIQFVEK